MTPQDPLRREPLPPLTPGWDPDPLTTWDAADDMCPNCVTPWKCNGPHLADETPYMQRLLAANRRGCMWWLPVLVFILALSGVPGVVAGEPPTQEVGTQIYAASATWCAPTPDKCQGWGGNARLAAVNSFTWGDEPYPVRVHRGDMYVDVTVVSFCACHGEDGYIDLSPAAFAVLEPDLGIGRIDVEVEVLTDLRPHPDDDRMRVEDGGPLPQTSTVGAP